MLVLSLCRKISLQLGIRRMVVLYCLGKAIVSDIQQWNANKYWIARPPVAAAGIEEAIKAEVPLVVWYVFPLARLSSAFIDANCICSITEGIPQHGQHDNIPIRGTQIPNPPLQTWSA